MLRIAPRVSALKSSSTMEISARAAELKAQGIDVISLAVGEPDFNTPKPIQEAATKAMADGLTKYTATAGFLALREAIAEKVARDNKLIVSPDEIIVTCGAKHALYLALQCLVEPGDAVLLPTPAWVSYAPMVEMAGAQIIPLPLFEEDGFKANVDRWKGMAIPPNARGIILNSPNNPTGVVYGKEDLIRLVGWALQRNLWIMSDEIYEGILYDGAKHVSIAALGPEVRNHTITISGFSKTHCMTGWRLGWAIADKSLISKMVSMQSQSTSHVSSMVQWAGITAARLPESYTQEMVAAFTKRRAYCIERLDKLSDYVSYTKPEGAFYFFINFSKFLNGKKMNDVELCKELLMKAHVGLVPGASFGKEKYVRLSYATSVEILTKAFDRIEAYLKQNS
jgi:aspartate aminotransferase